jgi:2-polyprenyl-3-methyl-5-hydroxy-6-metoxy-1,4-benzoquinol methylase
MQHIAEAQTRGIANAQFALVELNEFDPSTPFEQFDVITCLETIEHTGNPANALKNLVARTKPGGRLLIAVPDEQGLLGLTKLLARPLLRRCPYGSFFAGKSFTDYAVRVALRRPIGHFRAGGVKGYGPHLGWDVEAFERDLLGNEEAAGTLRRLWRRSVLGGFGRLYLFERA